MNGNDGHDESEEEEDDEKCPDTGLSVYGCPCSECTPMFIEPVKMFLDCRSLEEIVQKTRSLLEFLEYLEMNAFVIESVNDDGEMRLGPPIVGNCFWVRCPGCGYPILLDAGTDPSGMCVSCSDIMDALPEGSARYYGDLFEYVAERCNLRQVDGRDVWDCNHDLSFVEDFCRTHGVDFEVVRRRLSATDGYCDCEVLLNSMNVIPSFDELPALDEPGCDRMGPEADED